jgi:hypothetical protein
MTFFREWLDDFVIVYIDDILIYSGSMQEHAHHLWKVFQRLRENKLYAKLEKCEFGVPEVDFLRHRITKYFKVTLSVYTTTSLEPM